MRQQQSYFHAQKVVQVKQITKRVLRKIQKERAQSLRNDMK